MGIFRRLEIGGSARNINSSVRLVDNKKELDLLWIRISKGSKFIEKRSVPITNKKTKITTREDITMHKLDDGKTIIKYRTGSKSGGETIEMDAIGKGKGIEHDWKVHIKGWEPK